MQQGACKHLSIRMTGAGNLRTLRTLPPYFIKTPIESYIGKVLVNSPKSAQSAQPAPSNGGKSPCHVKMFACFTTGGVFYEI